MILYDYQDIIYGPCPTTRVLMTKCFRELVFLVMKHVSEIDFFSLYLVLSLH